MIRRVALIEVVIFTLSKAAQCSRGLSPRSVTPECNISAHRTQAEARDYISSVLFAGWRSRQGRGPGRNTHVKPVAEDALLPACLHFVPLILAQDLADREQPSGICFFQSGARIGNLVDLSEDF